MSRANGLTSEAVASLLYEETLSGPEKTTLQGILGIADVSRVVTLEAATLASLDPTKYQGQITALGGAIPAAGTAGRWYYSTVAGTLTDPDASSAVVQIGGYLIDSGSAWVARNAPVLMDSSTLTSLRKDTSRFLVSRNLFDLSKAPTGFAIRNDGVNFAVGGTFRASDFMPVTPGGTFVCNNDLYGTGTYGCAFYDWKQTFISFLGTGLTAGTAIAVPANACWVRVTLNAGVLADAYAIFDGSVVPSAIPGAQWADTLTNNSNSLVWTRERNTISNWFDKKNVVAGYALTTANGLQVAAQFSVSNYIPVVAGEQMTLSIATGAGSGYGICWYSLTKGYISGTAGTLAANTPYTVPALAAYCRFCLLTSSLNDMVVTHGTTLPTGYRDFGGSARSVRRWQSLGLGVMGDSITSGDGWRQVVSRYLQAPITLNSGTSGSSMGYKIGAVTSGVFASVDLLIVALGTNDWGFNRPLGALNDAASPAAAYANYAGTGTFYGDVRGLIEAILTEKPTLRFGFTTPLPRTAAAFSGGSGSGITALNGNGNTLRQFAQAIIDVCGQYAVPVLDLNLSSGLNTYNLSGFTNSNDGLHPTVACADFYAPQIGKWAEGL